jgi:hypothetical protein
MPAGVSVEAVDWLPSGARSGLVRVRGQRPPGPPVELPVLALARQGTPAQRFTSLPDPRADREPGAWRGAYVVDAALADAADVWELEWPGGPVTRLEKPVVEAPAPATAPEADAGGEVVHRAVLAERRARRAEAAEQAQARIAREALRAVEVLELRANQVEQRLAAAEAERDALRGRAAPAPAAPDPALLAEVEALRAEVARLIAQPAPEPLAPAPAADPARLREALAATVAVVADLRLQLHQAQLARRSREVAWSADAVKLTVLVREHEALRAALDTSEAELTAARGAAVTAAAALEEARAATAGARAAHEETRRRFSERVAELGAARERIATLEAEVAAVRAEGERSAAEAADAVRAGAVAAAEARVAEVEAEAAARVADAEAAAVAALERAERAEDAVADALIARELAEAAAVAARAERRAAEVAHAATQAAPLMVPSNRPAPPAFDLGGALSAAAGRLRGAPPATPEPEARAVPVPDEVAAGAAEQVGRAARHEPDGDDGPRVAADLAAAAEALRRRATIVSAPTDPPGDLARGRGARAYPPLRGALVKLAHDDPHAAARLIAGLLGATHAAIGPASFDLTLEGARTFAVVAGTGETTVTVVDRPRGRPHAAFHLRADGATVAELLAGVGPRPGRRGPARTSGRVRRARAAARALAATSVGPRELLAAGAAPDPLLALRCLAYAVHPSATQGLDACVEVTGPGGEVLFATLDGGGLHVGPEPPATPPDARLRLPADGVAAALGEGDLDADGDLAAVAALRGLALRGAGS